MDDPIGGQLLVQFILILINAFFAATEIAVISLNDNKVRKLAEDGDKKAAVMTFEYVLSEGMLCAESLDISVLRRPVLF